MTDLSRMNCEQLLNFLNTNVNRADDVWQRFNDMATEFERRNEDLTKAIGQLKARNKTDEYRIEDLIELRDKINDGFYVLKENEQEYPLNNRVDACKVASVIFKALERALEFAHGCCQQFLQRNEAEVRAEQEETRVMIRYVDHSLGDAHLAQMTAFLGIGK